MKKSTYERIKKEAMYVPDEDSFRRGTTYYISADGDDTNMGTDIGHPWKTVRPINAKGVFGPGDRVLFRGGDKFAGGLCIFMNGSGDALCELGSYGEGKAVFTDTAPFTSPICTVADSEYVIVRDLVFSGTEGKNYPGLEFRPLNYSVGLVISSSRRSG
ncbi:MAG: hypothetical protein VB106_01975, partial [Clostridiaceae bacterium]|nr:hypothetical protein [Clostridiaceae bacterium]